MTLPNPSLSTKPATKPAGEPQDSPRPTTPEYVDWWLTRWGRSDLVSGREPLTREHVEKLICANGGNSEGLDLSYRNLYGADLSELNLREARLQGASLGRANLRNADLFRADLQEADLFRADLRGTFLKEANMDRVYLLAVRIDDQTELSDAFWGHKHINEWERAGSYQNARGIYRQLFIWYKNHGYADVAGEFLYRDWVCKRLEAKGVLVGGLSWSRPWRILGSPKSPRWRALITLLWLAAFELLFGYGERPFRVSFVAAFVVLVFALIFFLYPLSEIAAADIGGLTNRLWHSFYFSLVSFTTLGYGGWVGHPDSWIRSLGSIESFIGLFITAMFLVTFTRKWTR